MILTNDRTTYITVFKTEFRPTLSVKRIGEIRKLPDYKGVILWRMEFTGRDLTYYSDLLSHSDKRELIRTLDKLNGFGPRMESDMERGWNRIIGVPLWSDIVLEGIKADKEWSDIVEDVETMMKER